MTAVATRRTPAKRTTPRPTSRKKAGRRGVLHVVTPLLVAALAAGGVALIYRVFVLSKLGQRIDTTALWHSDIGHARAVEIMQRTLDGTSLVSQLLVCVAVALIGIVRRRIDLAVAAAVMVIGANATSQLLKARLPRPALDGWPLSNSFPSGHTTAATSVAFALILVLPVAIRGVVALIGAAYASIIAAATVWAWWHRPSDTIAALLVVLAWGGFVTFWLRLRLRRKKPGPIDRPSTLAGVLFVAGGTLAMLITAVGLGAIVLSERVSPDLVSGRFVFLTGATAILAGVAAVFLIWVRLAAGDQPALESSVSTTRSEAVEKPREADK